MAVQSLPAAKGPVLAVRLRYVSRSAVDDVPTRPPSNGKHRFIAAPSMRVERRLLMLCADKEGDFMSYHRPGVPCRFCGQPIVLLDNERGRLPRSASIVVTIDLLCASCGHRGTYSSDQFGVFESPELFSGDWEWISRERRGRSAAVPQRK